MPVVVFRHTEDMGHKEQKMNKKRFIFYNLAYSGESPIGIIGYMHDLFCPLRCLNLAGNSFEILLAYSSLRRTCVYGDDSVISFNLNEIALGMGLFYSNAT